MSPDVRDLLKRGAATPARGPDMQRASRWAKSSRRRRSASLVVASLSVVALGTIVATNAYPFGSTDKEQPPAHDPNESFDPAEKDEPTYVLQDPKIEYPFALDQPRDGASDEERERFCEIRSCEPDPGLAGVTYEADWSHGYYPGDADCRIRVYSSDGTQVGEEIFGLSMLDPSLVHRGQHSVPVHVTSEPDHAVGDCEAGNYEPGPGYSFELIKKESKDWSEFTPEDKDLPPRTVLTFRTTFLVEEPATRACTSRIEFTDGRPDEVSEFTVSMAEEPHPLDLDVAGPPEDIAGANVTCREFRGE